MGFVENPPPSTPRPPVPPSPPPVPCSCDCRARLAALEAQLARLVDQVEVLDDHRRSDLRRALTLGELEAGRAGRYSG